MTSVKKQIVVETSQQRAFRTFTDGIDRWWPREHHGPSPLDPTGGSAPAPPAEPSGSPPPVSLRSSA